MSVLWCIRAIRGGKISTLKKIDTLFFPDNRGKLRKLHWGSNETVSEFGEIKEVFITESRAGTVRGLHFQLPPYEVNKIIHVICGSIQEIIVDLRLGSPAFGQIQEVFISENDNAGLLIPSGFAHGYQALSDNTKVLYLMDGNFESEYDSGININSFEIKWKIKNSIISDRDKDLINLIQFHSPFMFENI